MGETALKFFFTENGVVVDHQQEKLSESDSKWAKLFEENPYEALYHYGLASAEAGSVSAIFLKKLVKNFLEKLTEMPELEILREKAVVTVSDEEKKQILLAVPFALGAEHITEKWIDHIFAELNKVYRKEMKDYDGTVALYLAEKNQKLHVPERIFFHLVENKDMEYPFAFLATYATEKDGKVCHVPLKYALTEYQNEREKLLALLSCLNKAAEVSELIGDFMKSGEMFHPLKLTAKEAYEILKKVEEIEAVGILCRIPNWWRRHLSTPDISLKLGEEKPSMLGFDTLVTLQPQLVVDGVALTEADIRKILAQTEGLAYLKGKWIEVDHKKLQKLLKQMEEYHGEMTLMEALRMELGTEEKKADVGVLISNGKWLGGLLQSLRQPKTIRQSAVPKSLQATLRPYQKNGYTWLNYMQQLGFGACLADDMGLGKTVQVLAFLEKMRKSKKEARCLLIVPASLIGNWQKETEKFAPAMDYRILHGKTSTKLEVELQEEESFLTITTYGMAARVEGMQKIEWDCIILDEAQAIKNPLTKQTKAIKKLKTKMKIAMTGTPIENDLTNLWSLFDFLNKGLLGTSKEFKEYCKNLEEHPEGYARLKTMISPFMLRRLKTDKSIISDLPEKVEMLDYASLSKRQVVLYRKVVSDMEKLLLEAEEGIQRKGVVLAAIMKLKQVCNHPDQYLGQTGYAEEESGKFAMLREICETIYEKRERVIVFTQFKEITEYLAEYLEKIFHAKGYVLHGGTPVKERTRIVEAFQGEKYVPFIVLSVKAGGTGLTLTKANHVIHFDRWWNPAVENQATDRAFRIGQKKNVMVHKLVCKNTIEEKIDAVISGKKELAENVIGSGGENWITELNNEELMKLLRLE